MKSTRKLRLTVNELRVETFPTADAISLQRGTVKGHQESSLGGDCPSESWSGPVNCLCCDPSAEITNCCYTDDIDC